MTEPASPKPTAFDQVNTRRLLDYVRRQVVANADETCRHLPIDATTLAKLQGTTEALMTTLRDRGILQDTKIGESKMVNETWRDCYPRFFQRWAARLANTLLRRGILQTRKERWYHHVLPFTVQRVAIATDIDLLAMYLDMAGDDRDRRNDAFAVHTDVETNITLRTPQRYMKMNLLVRPITPVESVTIDFTFQKD